MDSPIKSRRRLKGNKGRRFRCTVAAYIATTGLVLTGFATGGLAFADTTDEALLASAVGTTTPRNQ